MRQLRPGVFEERPHLDLGLERRRFHQHGRRLQAESGGLQLLRVDAHDVVHRSVPEFRDAMPAADVLAVRPVDVECPLDELADRLHLTSVIRDHARATEVSHPREGIRRRDARCPGVYLAFAENLPGEARNRLCPGGDDRLRRDGRACLAEERLEECRVGDISRPRLGKPGHVKGGPLLVGQLGAPGVFDGAGFSGHERASIVTASNVRAAYAAAAIADSMVHRTWR